MATDEPARTAVVNVVRTPTGARVALRLEPSSGVVATFESFRASPSEHFLGGGERPGGLDLRGQALAVKTAYACQNTMPAPFFLSSSGYGVSLRSSTIASLGFPGALSSNACPGGATARCPLADGLNVVQLCAKTASLTYDTFFGSPRAIVSAYTKTIGRPQLPPTSEFELIKWRDVVGGSSDIFEDIDQLQALKVPIGWVMLDNPWESDACYGRMTFDAKRFPRPAAMIRQIHRQGVRFMLWVSPLIRQQFCPPQTQYPQSALFGTGGNAVTIDLSSPPVAAAFESDLQGLIKLGVDGFKGDRGDEIDLEPETLAGGPGTLLHNRYPLLYAQAVAAAVKGSGKQGDFATLFRAGAPGSSRIVPGFWAGDQEGTFTGLQQAIHDGLSAGIAGYPMWGSDTGGYGATASAEVFVRWAQFSALSPVFEVGGIGKNSVFWQYGAKTVNAFRDAAVLHYELFPTLYELAREAHATGVPILRPLALEYPDDPAAWTYDLEVLVGHDLLAAPVTTSGPRGAVKTAVYLPPDGTWVDLAHGTSVPGNTEAFVRPTPLGELPLYLRAGAAIPFAARTPLVWPKAWPTDSLQLKGRGGWLYAPAVGVTSVQNDDFGDFRAATSKNVVELTLTHAPKQTQILVVGKTLKALSIEGRTVPRAPSIGALRRAASGWAIVRKPFPGVVLKLAPHAGAAGVRLELR